MKVLKVAASPIAKVFGMLIPKAPKMPDAPKAVSRDDARESASLMEELNRRRGGQADIVTGSGGAEAGATGASRLG